MASTDLTATVTPRPDAESCEADGCTETDLLALVEPDGVDEARVVCPTHRVAFLREVTQQ